MEPVDDESLSSHNGSVLHTLAAGGWFVSLAFGGFLGMFLSLYLLCFTSLWWIVLPYLLWIWLFDRDVCEQGGRRNEYVRSWRWWKYFQEYFPIHFERVPGAQLDPNTNYLFCCFPHGVIPAGPFAALIYSDGGFKDLFPYHEPYVLALAQNFHMPFFREFALALGAVSASAKSIRHILSNEGGGNVAALAVGGAAESYFCRPGDYRVVLKNRKGFVRIALQCGAPLVPVISFGETEVFDQVGRPDGSSLHKVQEFIRGLIGVAPIIPLGRGFLQDSFGLIPRQRPITCLVGQPIKVEKVDNPTQEEVDGLHEKFVEHLTLMFDEHKHKYLQNADSIKLIVT